MVPGNHKSLWCRVKGNGSLRVYTLSGPVFQYLTATNITGNYFLQHNFWQAPKYSFQRNIVAKGNRERSNYMLHVCLLINTWKTSSRWCFECHKEFWLHACKRRSWRANRRQGKLRSLLCEKHCCVIHTILFLLHNHPCHSQTKRAQAPVLTSSP